MVQRRECGNKLVTTLPPVEDVICRCCRNFISGFAHRLNQLSLAKLAVTVSREFGTPNEAVSFLQEVRLALSSMHFLC